MKRIQRKARIWGVVVLCVSIVSALLAMAGLNNAVQRITEIAIAKTPDAILASADIAKTETVHLPVMYYDQAADECINVYDPVVRDDLTMRQFEWYDCGYNNGQIEQGLVDFELDDEKMPVAMKGQLLPNRGIDMARWYSVVDGKSEGYSGMLDLRYESDRKGFLYEEDEFYPLDEVEFDKRNLANGDKHNHLFTMSFAIPFTVLGSGEEEFVIEADDDTFVFVEDKLVVDMGGVHDITVGKFIVHENGEIYASVDGENYAYTGVDVVVGGGAMVRVFHADRDSKGSMFGMNLKNMDLNVVDTELAGEDGGVQIAYDPSNPTYIPPLGDSMTFRPDTTKGLITLATVEGVVIFTAALMVSFAARYLIKGKS